MPFFSGYIGIRHYGTNGMFGIPTKYHLHSEDVMGEELLKIAQSMLETGSGAGSG